MGAVLCKQGSHSFCIECSLAPPHSHPPPRSSVVLDLSKAPTHPLPESLRVTPSFIHFDTRRVSSCPSKESSSANGKQGSKCTGVVDVSRTSGRRGIVALPQQVRGTYILIDRGRPRDRFCRFSEGWGLYYPGGQGRGGRHSAAPSSGVARHLALFTAVECRVIEEGAAFTVPLGPFEVLVPLGPRHWLGALLHFWQGQREALLWTKLFIRVLKCRTSQQFKCLQLMAGINHGCHWTHVWGMHSSVSHSALMLTDMSIQ